MPGARKRRSEAVQARPDCLWLLLGETGRSTRVRSDVEVGVALLRLAHDELEAFGTDGAQRTSEDEMRLVCIAPATSKI